MRLQLSVNIREIVEFYDSNKSVRRHSNAVKTLAHEEFAVKVLVDFFGKRNQSAIDLGIVCTAKEGGAWLDAWVEVDEMGRKIHYQVEVKGWSFHGYGGGKSLPGDCGGEPLGEFMRNEFQRYWDSSKGRFHAPGLDKVLKEMKTAHKGDVRPLACVWAPMHPAGEIDEPLFSIDTVQGSHFNTVWIFSVSAYLRQLLRNGESYLLLNLPDTAARLEYLDRIFRS